MAIDPDVQLLLDGINSRIDGLSGGLPSGSSLQDAYDSLPDSGGVFRLEPHGRYDVADGLRLDRTKPVVVTSDGRPKRGRPPYGGPTPTIYSSTGAPVLISFLDPAAKTNAYGFEFSNLEFEISPTSTAVFDCPSVNMMVVKNCGAAHNLWDHAEAPFRFIQADHLDTTLGNDSSWFRVQNNYVRGGTLVHGVGFNLNQWVIRENVVFLTNATEPMIYCYGGHRLVIRDNNLEGADTTGIHLEECMATRLDGNGGEGTDPFIWLQDCNSTVVTDLGITNGDTEAFIRFTGDSASNLVISPLGQYMYDSSWWDDQTVNKDNWLVDWHTPVGGN